MESNKTYTVMKDGEILKELKTLAAAKKLADTEEAEVFSEGLCIYAPDPPVDEDVEDSLVVPKPSVKPDKYTLTAKMNIR